jgi:hypothetical protein
MVMTRRRVVRAQAEVGDAELLHLMLGYCLIAGGCALCDDIGAGESAARWVLRIDHAHEVWRQQREALLAAWYARLEQRGEPGAHGVPTFAEVLFDGAPMPRYNPAWPERVKQRRHIVMVNLAALHEHLRAHPQ